MDWGLMKKGARGLRHRMMYPSRAFYFLCIVMDLVGRSAAPTRTRAHRHIDHGVLNFFCGTPPSFAWSMTYLGEKGGPFAGTGFSLYLNPVLAATEIMRRTMWCHYSPFSVTPRFSVFVSPSIPKTHVLTFVRTPLPGPGSG